MNYKIEFKSEAKKFLKKQPRNQQERIKKAIDKLPDGDIKRMMGIKNQGLYRLRVR